MRNGIMNDGNELEQCVMGGCGKILDIRKDVPISERNFYIEGAGQLCKECHQEIYGSYEVN